MAGEAIVKSHDKYVLVSVSGDAQSPQDIKSTLSKAVEGAVKASLGIVIHRKMPVKQRASAIDFYYYAKHLAESSFRNKLALVFPKEMHHDNLDFFETTSKNRGIIIAIFSTMEEALNWIGGESVKGTA